ncbi:hypothetical protein [Shigella flexneri]|uniref:hypothetical protein n=1 Tax=Shigella flexneri TaxID=623 RepID=UPI001E2DF0D7|nr:hypothetical protein [Shigella flexneri]
MTTITKERLQWLANISGRDDIDDIDGGEIRELALIALASLEAEPVAECIVEDGGMCMMGSVSMWVTRCLMECMSFMLPRECDNLMDGKP